MYNSRNNRRNNSRNNNRGNRRKFVKNGKRRIKTFDPSSLVTKVDVEHIEAPKKYEPKNSFEDFEIDSRLKKNIIKRGYKLPTPIQDQAIPLILDRNDLIGTAGTGTGKTAAFLIPLIDFIIKDKSKKALIITPTRELAVQIESELNYFCSGLSIYSTLCIGGTSISKQVRGLNRNPHFVIGTPGRLKDLENRRALNFNKYSYIVLDEVDRMLDMGFINDMKYIIDKFPKARQSLFFSATLSPKLDDTINSFLVNPIKVEVEKQKSSKNVNQDVINVGGKAKIEILHDLLIKDGFDKVLVFGRTKFGLDRLAKDLVKRGFKVNVIHGNKSQNARQRALDEFKNDSVQILLATDIASRGLDINNVTHVINYDLPETYEDYIHRIGRTGRADKTGNAISFVG